MTRDRLPIRHGGAEIVFGSVNAEAPSAPQCTHSRKSLGVEWGGSYNNWRLPSITHFFELRLFGSSHEHAMAQEFSLFTSLRYDTSLKHVPASGLRYAGYNYENVSPLYMFEFHRDRMLRAATHWKWDRAVETLSGDDGLHALATEAERFVGSDGANSFRLRILVSKDGEVTFFKYHVPPTSLGNLFPERLPAPGAVPGPNEPETSAPLTLLVDNPNTQRSAYTHFKTTQREFYDQARTRAGIGAMGPADAMEVLIVNDQDGAIMEGSTTTPYFWREGQWITPPVSARFSPKEGSGGNDGTSRRWALQR